MKYLPLIPLLLFTSCASRPQPQVTVKPLSGPLVQSPESVRYEEIVRPYHLGRYVDPNHPDILHEQHPVFRVEARSRWNLKPGDPGAPGLAMLNPPRDAAFAAAPTNDAILAEMNRQREATRRVMQEASQLARSYSELQQVMTKMAVVARNHAWMGGRILSAEKRVGELESQLRQINLTSATNDTPFIEAPIAPKP